MKKTSLPRILVISMNSWNKQVGDNTFSLLLSRYPKNELAVLFIRDDKPDFELCNHYFHISEQKVFKSILKRNTKTGTQINKANCDWIERPDGFVKKQYRHKKSFYYLKLFFRELLWKQGKWKTLEFTSFLKDFKPDIILYEISRYPHLNNIIVESLKITNAKGIGCFWDDTFSFKQRKNIGYFLFRLFQRKNVKKLVKKTTSFFAITKKTKDEADLVFNINCAILTKPVQQTAAYYSTQPHKKIKMLYTGNIDFGRFDSLNKIAKEIGENNSYQLDIYTKSFLTNRQKKKLNKNNVFIYKSIPQEQIIELQKQYDVLVFVESLSSFNKDARLSFSTKLVDYFSAGKCIFAVGNEDLAPISYLKDSNSALVATKKKDISSCLLRMKDKGVLSFYSKRSFELGIKKHSWIDIEKTFFGVVLGTVK